MQHEPSPRVPETLPRVANAATMDTTTNEATVLTNMHMANSVTHPVTGKAMEYRQLITDSDDLRKE